MTTAPVPESKHITTRFTTSREALVAAIAMASTVPAEALSRQPGSGGALFVVDCQEGRASGAIYCRSHSMVSRGFFPVDATDLGGPFVLPARLLPMFEKLPEGDRVTVEAGTEDKRFRVRFRAVSGASYDGPTYDPSLVRTCELDRAAATETASIPAQVLAGGLRVLSPFIPLPDDEFLGDAADVIRAVPGGRLIALSGTKLATFSSPDLLGAKFQIRRHEIGPLLKFVARSNAPLSVRVSQSMSYLVTREGHAIGWPNGSVPDAAPSTYADGLDDVVVTVPRDVIIGRITSLIEATKPKQYVRLAVGQTALRFICDAPSWEVSVPSVAPTVGAGLAFEVQLRDLLMVVAGLRGRQVELRVAIARVPAGSVAVVRTRETFPLRAPGRPVVQAAPATVTRYVMGIRVVEDRPAGSRSQE